MNAGRDHASFLPPDPVISMTAARAAMDQSFDTARTHRWTARDLATRLFYRVRLLFSA